VTPLIDAYASQLMNITAVTPVYIASITRWRTRKARAARRMSSGRHWYSATAQILNGVPNLVGVT
jgi:hypothetical protein